MYYPYNRYVRKPARDYSLAYKALKYAAPIVPAYLMGSKKAYSSGPPKTSLSGEGIRGGAAPIPSKSASSQAARRKRQAKKKKCNKMKGYALRKEVCELSNAVKELKQESKASQGKLTYRARNTGRLLVGNNSQSIMAVGLCSKTSLETVGAQLQYYDPSTPGTLLTADMATGTYSRQYLFKSFMGAITIRNNYQSDVDVKVYLCTPKDDTDIPPNTAWANGATDGSNATSTTIGVYPSDFSQFRDVWNSKQLCNKSLSPGETTKVSHVEKNFLYDPSVTDAQSQLYQKLYKSFSFMIVIQGCPAHDTSLYEVGYQQAGVDLVFHTTAVVHYDAGVGLERVYIDNNLPNPTNGFVQSHQPIPDNIAYSVA